MAKIVPLTLSAPEPKPFPPPIVTSRSCEKASTTLAIFGPPCYAPFALWKSYSKIRPASV